MYPSGMPAMGFPSAVPATGFPSGGVMPQVQLGATPSSALASALGFQSSAAGYTAMGLQHGGIAASALGQPSGVGLPGVGMPYAGGALGLGFPSASPGGVHQHSPAAALHAPSLYASAMPPASAYTGFHTSGVPMQVGWPHAAHQLQPASQGYLPTGAPPVGLPTAPSPVPAQAAPQANWAAAALPLQPQPQQQQALAPAAPQAQLPPQPPRLPSSASTDVSASAVPGAVRADAARVIRRDELCEQAFNFVDGIGTGHIDLFQNKTGLTMVFESLGDVPMPKDEWYNKVFANFVRDEEASIDFDKFKDIVVQWDEHHLKKRWAREAQARNAAAGAGGAPLPPPPGGSSAPSASAPPSGARSVPESSWTAGTASAASSMGDDHGQGRDQRLGSNTQSEKGSEGVRSQGPAYAGAQEQRDAGPQAGWQPAADYVAESCDGEAKPPDVPEDAPDLYRGPSPNSGASGRGELVSTVSVPTYVGRLAIFDHYVFLGDVGHGSFGKVMVVRHKQTKELRACKSMAVQTALHRELFDTEIRLLKSLKHPNIMKMHEVYLEEQGENGRIANGNIYLIAELCEGGDLSSRIVHHYEKLKQPMTEAHVAYMMQQILSATKYCHDQGIIHRDIKPENILFVDRSSSSPLKIIDFGLANFTEKIREQAREKKIPRTGAMGKLARMLPSVNGKHLIPWHERKKVMQKAGTPHYMAPEMIEGYYDQKADIFSIGIILCQLLTGWHPFYVPGEDNEQSVHAKISNCDQLVFPSAVWGQVSREAVDLSHKLLEREAKNRLSAGQALAHPWFQDPSKPSPYENPDGGAGTRGDHLSVLRCAGP